jgi:beta-lactamase regulating signal transducer with metallopeptidase domain
VNRALLVVTVLSAAYALSAIVLSAVVAAIWHSGVITRAEMPGAARARRIVLLRAVPVAGSLFITFALVAPAFTMFEPLGRRGVPGPIIITLAAVCALVLVASAIMALRAALATLRIERNWLRQATMLPIDPPAGVPAYTIDSREPIVALVGVFSPKLVAARSVIEACSQAELANIVAHERGHLRARDNLKRWLMTCAPDVLRWTPVHASMLTAWCDAAEDAADDAATGTEDRARLDLAALLVKIAGLGVPPTTAVAGISPLVQADGLERRVRRLLAAGPAPAPQAWPRLLPAIAACALVTTLITLLNPSALELIYEATEAVIRVGR